MSASPSRAGDGPWLQVAVDVALPTALTWTAPKSGTPQRGSRVIVPFRNQLKVGIVTGVRNERPPGLKRVRRAIELADATPTLPEPLLDMLEWMARYYHAPLGRSVALAVPAALLLTEKRARWELGDSPPQADDERAVAAAIREAGHALSATEIRHHVPVTLARLTELEVADIVRASASATRQRTRARSATLISPTTTAGDASRLGERQQRVVDFVKEHGETGYDELRELYGIDRSVVRSLLKRELITTREVEVIRDPFAGTTIEARTDDPVLTPEQAEAVERICRGIDGDGSRILLHGVTGSGKTEVYLRAIRHVRATGRSALILLPEIALTPQFVGVIQAAVNEPVAVLHSGLNDGERYDAWRRIRRGEVGIVIGARSALFAPMSNIGLVVVDEEHDTSFKQGDRIRYNARDCATVLAARHRATIVLGSATPSLESLHNCEQGRYALLRLPQRVHRRPMPAIELIDMRAHPPDEADPASAIISSPLQKAVRDTVSAGEQAILFLNRRGFSNAIQCCGCGEALRCASCDISLTHHRRGDVMRCHMCGFSASTPESCPQCGDRQWSHRGAGTEQIEELVGDAFPDLRVGRLDRDSTRSRALGEVLGAFRRRELDLLVGTQMVTKGHDFPGVTLVGVLSGDQALRYPDFRSGERSFQLLTQVAGRAGRAELPGRVIIQTWKPEHYVLSAVAEYDFDGFVRREMRFRRRVGWPPFGYVALLVFDGAEFGDTMRAANELASALSRTLQEGTRLRGPVEAPIARVRDRYRVHLLIQAPQRNDLHRQIDGAVAWRDANTEVLRRAGLRVAIDIDPIGVI